MIPYYTEPGITIFHGDCREILPTLKGVDCIVTDPPYGMNWNTDMTRWSGGQHTRGDGIKRKKITADDKPFDPSPFLSVKEVMAIGIEIEERYCEIAIKRLRQEVLAI